MQTITLNSFLELSNFLNNNPTYQILEINTISETEIIVTYIIPT